MTSGLGSLAFVVKPSSIGGRLLSNSNWVTASHLSVLTTFYNLITVVDIFAVPSAAVGLMVGE